MFRPKQGKKKQHKHKFFGPDFPRAFLTLTPGRPWVKKFLSITGAAEKRSFWCGRPRLSARTSVTRRVLEKVCTKKFALIFWPLPNKHDRFWSCFLPSFSSVAFVSKLPQPCCFCLSKRQQRRQKTRFLTILAYILGRAIHRPIPVSGETFWRTLRAIGPYKFP